MPAVPLETKYHPSAVDLLLIKRLIGETSKQNLLQFLQHEFVNIGKAHAERLIGINFLLHTLIVSISFINSFESIFYHATGEMGPDFSSKTQVNSLTSQQIVRMHQLFRQAKFDDPSGDVRCFTIFNVLSKFGIKFVKKS